VGNLHRAGGFPIPPFSSGKVPLTGRRKERERKRGRRRSFIPKETFS
jgi:hypothetical protein